MSRQASSPSIANGGRGRARHSSSVIRKFCVVRATPFGRQAAKAVLGVAEGARDRVRRHVVEEGRGLRDARPEAVEGEAEHRRAHLLAEPAALELPADPRSGRHRLVDGKVLRPDRLRADRAAVEDGQEVEAPVRRRPGGAHPPVVLQEPAFEPGARDRRPGHRERHLAGRVDPRARQVQELDELVIGRQAQLEVFGPKSQAEERPGVGQGGSGTHGRPTVHSAHGCCRDDGRLLREAQYG